VSATALLILAKKLTLLYRPNSQPISFRIQWQSFSLAPLAESLGESVGSAFRPYVEQAMTGVVERQKGVAITPLSPHKTVGAKRSGMNTCAKTGEGATAANVLFATNVYQQDELRGVKKVIRSFAALTKSG
jgi:hypothetical protein